MQETILRKHEGYYKKGMVSESHFVDRGCSGNKVLYFSTTQIYMQLYLANTDILFWYVSEQ